MKKIGVNTITSSTGGDKDIKETPPNPTKIISPWESWAEELGSKLVKEVKIEIPGSFISQTQKTCSKCNQIFVYNQTDDLEISYRKLYSSKKGNLDLCLTCDEIDKK